MFANIKWGALLGALTAVIAIVGSVAGATITIVDAILTSEERAVVKIKEERAAIDERIDEILARSKESEEFFAKVVLDFKVDVDNKIHGILMSFLSCSIRNKDNVGLSGGKSREGPEDEDKSQARARIQP